MRDARATGPRNAIDQFETGNTGPRAADVRGGVEDDALAATLLFVHGQTTERTVTAAERLGRALGVTVKLLPYWGEISSRSTARPSRKLSPPSRSVSTWAGYLPSRG